eukprot:9194204-Heterocapsa_arctica.AAC.1
MARYSFGGLEDPRFFTLCTRSGQSNFLRADDCKSEDNNRSRLGNYLRTTSHETRVRMLGKDNNYLEL